MRRHELIVFAAAFVCGLSVVVGCARDSATPEPGASRPSGYGEPSAQTKIEEALAQLSAEERAAAQSQKVCPVSDEALGSMGKPVKVTVKGREVFLCCSGCRKAIEGDPDEYLAKLDSEQAK